MTDVRQNEFEDEDVKLVFDVMAPGADSQRAAVAGGHGDQSDGAPESGQVTAAGTAPGARFKLKIPAITPNLVKILVSVAVVAVLGVGGYYGYKYLTAEKITTPPVVPPKQVVQPVKEPAMPKDWLKKYFGSEECTDVARCGPNADPDNDSLSNIKEYDLGTNPLEADTDFDGVADIDEVQIYSTEPISADTDGDGHEDGSEISNGYSPVISGSKASAIEKQVWKENTEKYGLHEPTKTFLGLKSFTTRFDALSTTTAQLSFSIPPDWSINYQTAQNFVELASPDGRGKMIVYSPSYLSATTTEDKLVELDGKMNSLPGYKLLTASRRDNLGKSIYIKEYTYISNNSLVVHGKMYVIVKKDDLLPAAFEAPDSDWQNDRVLADTILNSVR